MILPEYLSSVTRKMQQESSDIRRHFRTHNLSAGENREELVTRFLAEHLPKRFEVTNGLVIDHKSQFSKQADVLIVDSLNNSPLYGKLRHPLWPVESVFALIEVKTKLDSTTLKDAIEKGRAFKKLPRNFCDVGSNQRIRDSLFVIWAFESADPLTVKGNLEAALADVPRVEQPDFLVVPDKLVALMGKYQEVAFLGQEGSPCRSKIRAQYGDDWIASQPAVRVGQCNENSLMTWYVWFDSWLRQAGNRYTDPTTYLPPDATFGTLV